MLGGDLAGCVCVLGWDCEFPQRMVIFPSENLTEDVGVGLLRGRWCLFLRAMPRLNCVFFLKGLFSRAGLVNCPCCSEVFGDDRGFGPWGQERACAREC